MARPTKAVTKTIKKEKGWRWSEVAAVSIGIALIALGGFMGLSFFTGDVGLDPQTAAKSCWTGLLGAWIAFGGIHTLGYLPAMVFAALLVFWGVHIVRGMRFLTTWPQVVGGVLIIVSASIGSCAFADCYDMHSGGLLAVYVSPPALLYFGRWGLILASVGVLVLGVLLSFGEAAVATVHQIVHLVRDIALGFVGVLARLRDLLRLLLFPRLAVAGGTVAERPVERQKEKLSLKDRLTPRRLFKGSEDGGAAVATTDADDAKDGIVGGTDESGADEQDEIPAPDAKKRPIRDWKPRETFCSRYLNLDLRRDRDSASESEPVKAAIAPEVEDVEIGNVDIIMDVDAQSEESDAVKAASSASDVIADPVALVEPPRPVSRPREPRQVREETASARPGAYGSETAQRDRASGPVSDMADYQLPPLNLLDPPEPPVVEDRGQIEGRARILEQTLGEFKIEGRVVHIERGPRVTMYELSLAPGIRLSKVTSLADNIAMQLQAESVRIIAPIPGKNTIGIEIPNTCKELVSLREIVGTVNRAKRKQALPVCLGKDVSGMALVADLARMPHLLIAGATGSGKSVCINSIIMSVMMCCRPDEAQLIMVDPKVVELSRFKDIPHLMSPVITDMKRAVSVLEWICQKMDERYEQMSQVSVNNIAKFNALGEEGIRSRLDAFASLEEIEAFPKKMPYMVVIIDELADLMMVAGKEVEQHITRLAAKSRAVGIHLILATQRPSVDVITGLIKANMPCRIAFQVASRVDSRTILDGNGAETLLGQGDMLYLPPGVGKLTRAQGVFVSDEELFRVVDFTKAEAEPQYHDDLLGPVIGGNNGAVDVSSFDDLFLQSGEAIIENQRGSVSLLQRKFGIGYGRASRIIDQLESVGLLGQFREGKAREILLSMEEFRAKFGGGSGGAWDDDSDDGTLAGLRDDERERDQAPWDDDEPDM